MLGSKEIRRRLVQFSQPTALAEQFQQLLDVQSDSELAPILVSSSKNSWTIALRRNEAANCS